MYRMTVEADSSAASGELALTECRNVGHHRGESLARAGRWAGSIVCSSREEAGVASVSGRTAMSRRVSAAAWERAYTTREGSSDERSADGHSSRSILSSTSFHLQVALI